ncbi:uncharacterized protein BROUX77_000561 [Berkeleyomyces rouxiae]|uniref:uncharacterized protein n=1 Tax=Berkeleyomyces rouxiae TaxID=2035830 RepID=UPI003B7E7FB2
MDTTSPAALPARGSRTDSCAKTLPLLQSSHGMLSDPYGQPLTPNSTLSTSATTTSSPSSSPLYTYAGVEQPTHDSSLCHSSNVNVTRLRTTTLLHNNPRARPNSGKASHLPDGYRQSVCLASGSALDGHKIDTNTRSAQSPKAPVYPAVSPELHSVSTQGTPIFTGGPAGSPVSPAYSTPRSCLSFGVVQDSTSVTQARPAILRQSQMGLEATHIQDDGALQLQASSDGLWPYECYVNVSPLSLNSKQQDSCQYARPEPMDTNTDNVHDVAPGRPLSASDLPLAPPSLPPSPGRYLRKTLPRPRGLVFRNNETKCLLSVPVSPLSPRSLSSHRDFPGAEHGAAGTGVDSIVGVEARLPAGPLLKGGCSLPRASATASATQTSLRPSSHQSFLCSWVPPPSDSSMLSPSLPVCSADDGSGLDKGPSLEETAQKAKDAISHQLDKQLETRLVPDGEKATEAPEKPVSTSLISTSLLTYTSLSPLSLPFHPIPSAQPTSGAVTSQTTTTRQTETQAQLSSHHTLHTECPTERDPSCQRDNIHSETSIQPVEPESNYHTPAQSFTRVFPPSPTLTPAHITNIEPPSPVFSFCSENFTVQPLSTTSSVPAQPLQSLAGSGMTSQHIPDSLNGMGSGFSSPWAPTSGVPIFSTNPVKIYKDVTSSAPSVPRSAGQPPLPVRKVSATSTVSSVFSTPSSFFSSSDPEARFSVATSTCSAPFTSRNSLLATSQSDLGVSPLTAFIPHRSAPRPKHLSQPVEPPRVVIPQPVRPHSNSASVPSSLQACAVTIPVAGPSTCAAKSLVSASLSSLAAPAPPHPVYQCILRPWTPISTPTQRPMTVTEPQVSYFDTDTDSEEEDNGLQDIRSHVSRSRAISRLFGPKRKSLRNSSPTSTIIGSGQSTNRLSATERDGVQDKQTQAKPRGGKGDKRKSRDSSKTDKSVSDQHSETEAGPSAGPAAAAFGDDKNSFLHRTNEQMLGMLTHMRLPSGFMSKKQKEERRKQNIKRHIRVLHETSASPHATPPTW